jgi:hypothetical protein
VLLLSPARELEDERARPPGSERSADIDIPGRERGRVAAIAYFVTTFFSMTVTHL